MLQKGHEAVVSATNCCNPSATPNLSVQGRAMMVAGAHVLHGASPNPKRKTVHLQSVTRNQTRPHYLDRGLYRGGHRDPTGPAPRSSLAAALSHKQCDMRDRSMKALWKGPKRSKGYPLASRRVSNLSETQRGSAMQAYNKLFGPTSMRTCISLGARAIYTPTR